MSARRNITVRLFLFWVLIVFAGRSFLFAGQIPKSEKEIPIISGAVRDVDQESSSKNQMGWENNPNLRSAGIKAYKTGASPEEVFNFYLQKIGGREGTVDVDPRGIERGAVSQVWYEIDGFYTDEDFRDYDIEGSKHPGTWMKQSLTKNRTPHVSGNWIKDAKFNWFKKESNNDLTTFYILIHDNSFDFAQKKYETAASIEIQVTTEKSEQASREESVDKMEQKNKELSESLTSKPPTAKELGVPLYPGAKFDANNSAGMSAGNDYAVYIYLTTDRPSIVAAFYEQQLKIKPIEVGKDQYMIPLKGKMPVPDEGISIQLNTMIVGNAKTVISIKKIAGQSQ